jgi:hypothetical protein
MSVHANSVHLISEANMQMLVISTVANGKYGNNKMRGMEHNTQTPNDK